MYDPYYGDPFEEPEPPSCECGAIFDQACEPDCGRITAEREDLNELALAHALDMVYASLNGTVRDMDWERERNPYAEELALEARHRRREIA